MYDRDVHQHTSRFPILFHIQLSVHQYYSHQALKAFRLQIRKWYIHSSYLYSNHHYCLLYSMFHQNKHNDVRRLFLHSQREYLIPPLHTVYNDFLYIHHVHKSALQLHFHKCDLRKEWSYQSYLQKLHST